MLPFVILIGGWLGEFLNKFFATPETPEMKNTNFIPSDSMFDFIADYEGYSAKPYKLKGENFYTIGYGSTRIYSPDGKSSRLVKATDVLTKTQAIQQMKLYYLSASSPKNAIDKILKEYGGAFNQRFYDMLVQCSYTSGSFHRMASFQNTYRTMIMKSRNNTDVNVLGELIKDTWIAYVKTYAPYNINGLGWSRRAFGISQYVKGLDWTKNNATNKIKKPY